MSERDWIAAGLYDPEAPDADERRALLEYLAGLGLSPDDVAEAARLGRLDRLAADHVLWRDEGPTLTVEDLAARTGFDESFVRAIIRASGEADSPDEPRYREAHVRVFEAAKVGVEIFTEDAILQFLRVLGSAAAQIADAAVALFFSNVSPRLDAGHVTELERVRTAAGAVDAFSVVPSILDVLVREHFVTAIRRSVLLDVRQGGAIVVTVAFVDLVGSTEVARSTDTAHWSEALAVFERTAMDAAIANDGRVVKLIGDEVMLVMPSPPTAVVAVRAVLEAVAQHPLLGSARAGIANGEALSRDGDYFGPVVNLAARLVGVADAGEVLVDGDVARGLGVEGNVVEPAGVRVLKGLEGPVSVYRVRR